MITFKVLEPARVRYELTTWEGKIEYEGESITYRYSEDNHGAELYVLIDGEWDEVDTNQPPYEDLYNAIMEYGSPAEFGEIGEEFNIND